VTVVLPELNFESTWSEEFDHGSYLSKKKEEDSQCEPEPQPNEPDLGAKEPAADPLGPESWTKLPATFLPLIRVHRRSSAADVQFPHLHFTTAASGRTWHP
jgi:hypothetical protein